MVIMDDKKKKLVPALRFGGFEKEWISHKFGNSVLSSAFGPRFSSNLYSNKGNFITLRTTDMDNEGQINYKKAPLAILNLEDFKDHLLVENDLIISRSGTIGITGIFKKYKLPVIPGAFLIRFRLRTEDLNPQFIKAYFNGDRGRNKLKKLSAGGVQKNLKGSSVLKMSLLIPTLPEQQKIANFLSSVDKKIEQLRQKVSLLEDYKKGVMQQIFSQQIRFKDDNGEAFADWEVKKAKDIFKNHSNKKHDGNLPILAITQDRGTVYRDDVGIDIKTSMTSIKSYKIIESGDFIISLRSFQGGIECSTLHGICSPAYTILKPTIEIYNDFFKYYFKKESFIRQLSSTVVGIRDGKQISYSAFSGLKLLFPSIQEQQKIANFLSSIDDKIQQTQTQLAQNQQFKKGLLQQMFV